ncbi:MAG: PEF-CTERM sorting domain-containing protein [Candidatus Bathyarchaeia archaeon]
MRNGIYLLTFCALALIVLCNVQIQMVRALPTSSIYIESDGSVVPSTAPIQQAGNTYKVTSNISGSSIVVLKNNIVLDGQGFTLNSGNSSNQAAINLTCSGVTITNFHVIGWLVGVLGVFDSNIILDNNFTNNGYDVAIYANNYRVIGNFIGSERIVGNNNVISNNEIGIRDNVSGFWISSSLGTVIESNDVTFTKETTSFVSTDNENYRVTHNNFLNIEVNTGGALLFVIGSGFPYWDNNYWSDYASKYPNASQVDTSGIWDTPYVPTVMWTTTLDRYPLITPYNFTKPIMVTEPNPTLTPNPTANPSIPEFSPWIALLIALSIGLIAFFVNRKRLLENPRVP